MSRGLSRAALAGAALSLLVAGGALAPVARAQVLTPAEEEAERRREQGARLVGEALSAWPASYPYFRPRPPQASGPLQRLYPWQMLGSPFVAVLPLGEIHFMGLPPSMIDGCYGLFARNEATPLMFRASLGDALPYLAAGYGESVLRAWAEYLGEPVPEPRARYVAAPVVVETIRGWLAARGYLVEDPNPDPGLAPPARPVEMYQPRLPVCYPTVP